MNCVYFALSTDYCLRYRDLFVRVDIEAFSLEFWMLVEDHVQDEVAIVSVDGLIALLFDSEQHAIIDALWYLHEQLRVLADDALAFALGAVY